MYEIIVTFTLWYTKSFIYGASRNTVVLLTITWIDALKGHPITAFATGALLVSLVSDYLNSQHPHQH